MHAHRGPIIALAFIAAMSAGITGCGSKNAGRSTLGTKIGEREVKASVDGAGFISTQGDSAVITFSGGRLVVERGAVRLDDRELAQFSEDARQVLIDYTAGKLSVTADGAEVLTTTALPD